MKWIDAHLHLSTYTTDQRRDFFCTKSQRIHHFWVMAGLDSKDWLQQIPLRAPNVLTAFGLHPWRVVDKTPEDIHQQLRELEALLPQADFLGETGLDAFHTRVPEKLQIQEDIFVQHLELNRKWQRPLVLHVVQRHERAFRLLKPYPYVGLVHGFSGSWEVAQSYIDLGYKISVGRGVYHQGYKALKETVKKISLSDLLIESDAYNDIQTGPEDALSIYQQVVHAVCEIKQISQQQLEDTVMQNLNTLLVKDTQ